MSDRWQEPYGMLDLEEPPETYGIDEVGVFARDPWTLFAYWEITTAGRASAEASLGGTGDLMLRIYSVTGGPDGGPHTEMHDEPLTWDHGRRYFKAPRTDAHVTAAVGLRAADGRFAPIAHAPRIRLPFTGPGPDGPVEWMEVVPARSRGALREPPRIAQRGPAEDPPPSVPQKEAAPLPVGAGASPWRWLMPQESSSGRSGGGRES